VTEPIDEFAPDAEVGPAGEDPYHFESLTEAEREFVDQLLGPGQVAELLALSRQRVDQLMGHGPLPVLWIGGRRHVLRRHVARYAEVEGLPRPASARRWRRVTSQPPVGGA
jgi:hypothetical protein